MERTHRDKQFTGVLGQQQMSNFFFRGFRWKLWAKTRFATQVKVPRFLYKNVRGLGELDLRGVFRFEFGLKRRTYPHKSKRSKNIGNSLEKVENDEQGRKR